VVAPWGHVIAALLLVITAFFANLKYDFIIMCVCCCYMIILYYTYIRVWALLLC
jgi:hypothetical protein